MWHAIFEQTTIVSAVLFCGITIKLIDDFLDKNLDIQGGCPNFSKKFGDGIIIYALLSFAIATSINAVVSIPLFLASYSIGMSSDLKHPFPSGLSGMQEAVVVFFLGVLFWGWQNMVFSLLFMFALQLFDDYLDMYTDQCVGYRNLAHRLGKVECVLLGIISLLSAWQVGEHMFLPVFFGASLVYGILFLYQKGAY